MNFIHQISDNWDSCLSMKRNNIVFENRLQEYGAYQIRRDYFKTVFISFLGALFFAGAITIVPTILYSYFNSKFIKKVIPTTDLIPVDPDLIYHYKKETIKTETPAFKEKPAQSFSNNNVEKVPLVENKDIKNDELPLKKNIDDNGLLGNEKGDVKVFTHNPLGSGAGGGSNSGKGNEDIDDIKPTLIADKMPEFVGGEEALFNFIRKNINYPSFEKSELISGTVYVTFVINKNGKVENAVITRGVKGGKGLEAEALRVINKMPDWTPGQTNNKPVKVQFTFPIKFVLQ
ncbi:MAG: energy transducer TonB [Bacteroidota bacterium]